MPFWWCAPTPQNIIYWSPLTHSSMKLESLKRRLSTCYGLAYLPYDVRTLLYTNFDYRISSLEITWTRWLYNKSELSSSYITDPQNVAWMSLPSDCGVSLCWWETMWSQEVPAPGPVLFFDLILPPFLSLDPLNLQFFLCTLVNAHTVYKFISFMFMIHFDIKPLLANFLSPVNGGMVQSVVPI